MAFDFLGNLARLGFFDLILPWVLFFAIIYGLLSKVNLFGGGKEGEGKGKIGDKVNLVIAIVLAFFGINYTTIGANVGLFLTNLFGVGGLVLSVVLLIALLLPLFGADSKLLGLLDFSGKDKMKKNLPTFGLILLVVAIGAFFVTGGGKNLPSLGFYGISSDLLTTIIIVVIMLAVIGFVFMGGGGHDEPRGPPAPTP